jgi:hypothetical protein
MYNIAVLAIISAFGVSWAFTRTFLTRHLTETKIIIRRDTAVLYNSKQSEWWKRSEEEEEVIYKVSEAPFEGTESLFDSIYKMENSADEKSEKYTLAQFTLRDIAEAYRFSIDFLGDFVVQMGLQPPVDVDVKLANILTGQQIATLMEALTSLDPYDTNADFDGVSVIDLADELDIPVKTVIKICAGEGFNLPFGASTILHAAVVDKVREVYEYDDYQNFGNTNSSSDDDDDE